MIRRLVTPWREQRYWGDRRGAMAGLHGRRDVPETVAAVRLPLAVPDWGRHRAGQHVDVRLTAEDGYSAQRSYSIASAPGADLLELTIVRLDDGEVSPYLTTVLDVGDPLELRGPVGGCVHGSTSAASGR